MNVMLVAQLVDISSSEYSIHVMLVMSKTVIVINFPM